MSSQRSFPYPGSAASPPGIALVCRLDAPPPTKPSYFERAVHRLCLYPLPVISTLPLNTVLRAAGMHPFKSISEVQFAVALTFAWIAALESFQAIRADKINREHTGSMSVLASACVAIGVALLLLYLLAIPLPDLRQCITESSFFLLASIIVNVSFREMFRVQNPLTRVVVADMHVSTNGTFWTLTCERVSRHEISGAIRLESTKHPSLATILRSTNDLVREIQREPVEGVLISASPAEVVDLSEQLRACGSVSAPVHFILGSADGSSSHRIFANANSLYLLNVGAAPTKTPHYTFIKRWLDIAFSIAAILLGAPLIALISITVKMSSKGGIFFVQDRVGWNGRIFRMYKFRTMCQVPTDDSDTCWSRPNDARRTPIGRILRKYSLDELPQFFNVLKGDMSIVGPRPERPYFVNSFRREIDEYHRRHLIKVGITGWAQVNGLRGDTCIRTRLLYDLYYLQNWGLVFDLKILFRTVFCVLFGRNGG